MVGLDPRRFDPGGEEACGRPNRSPSPLPGLLLRHLVAAGEPPSAEARPGDKDLLPHLEFSGILQIVDLGKLLQGGVMTPGKAGERLSLLDPVINPPRRVDVGATDASQNGQ